MPKRTLAAQAAIEVLDEEIDLFARLVRGRLAAHSGYRALQTIPGIGPTLAAADGVSAK